MQQESANPAWFWVALVIAGFVTAVIAAKCFLYPQGLKPHEPA